MLLRQYGGYLRHFFFKVSVTILKADDSLIMNFDGVGTSLHGLFTSASEARRVLESAFPFCGVAGVSFPATVAQIYPIPAVAFAERDAIVPWISSWFCRALIDGVVVLFAIAAMCPHLLGFGVAGYGLSFVFIFEINAFTAKFGVRCFEQCFSLLPGFLLG